MRLTKVRTFSMLAGFVCLTAYGQDPYKPQQVEECLKSPKAAGLEVLDRTNPFYLRGDFDGDGKPDYALQVRSSKKGGAGVLVCTSRGSIFLLGSGIGGSQFYDASRCFLSSPVGSVHEARRRGPAKRQQ